MKTTDWSKFGEKVRLAVEASLDTHYGGGLSGLELEFNVLDEALRPVTVVGYGPKRRSFADYLLAEHMNGWAQDRCHLEVFHWMVEVVTRPYYGIHGTVMEGRILESVVLNALARTGLAFGERFYPLHGNLPGPVAPDEDSIPDGWPLAKKKYLARCVALFGAKLATAGIHTNHSYPEALLSWDFFHLPRHRREGRTLIDFRTEAVIRATRLLRPFCPLFIAATASTPLAWEGTGEDRAVVLTENDSNRLLTFPNPPDLDVPYLYASHQDYIRISYDLVRRGVRFGANNWTPVRARSDVDPVNRNIFATSEQLANLYQKGLYRPGGEASVEEAEKALMIENLCARVDLPMNRVEVRTDEGGDSFELAAAKVALKELLMLRIYADEGFGANYAYDADDVARARRNEDAAARHGLRAQIEDPFSGGKIGMREFLVRTLDDLAPLAEALDYGDLIAPLRAMADGAPNEAETVRRWFEKRTRGQPRSPEGRRIVPPELVREWIDGRTALLQADLGRADSVRKALGEEGAKLAEVLEGFREAGARDPSAPLRLDRPEPAGEITTARDRLSEVLALAQTLCRIPSVTNCPRERLDEVWRCGRFIAGWLREAGAEVRLFEGGKYPSVMAGFPGALTASVTLGGHFDVVEPDPNDTQFDVRIEGDYLWGRGTADMKTVVASDMVWMKSALAAGPPYPPFNLLFVGNEENGEADAYGTPQVLEEMHRVAGWAPEFMILGERTGEKGTERFGDICVSNRGVVRLTILARGEKAHTGMAGVPRDMTERLIAARKAIQAVLARRLTLKAEDGWASGARFPFLNCGEPGVYNVTPSEGRLGLEVRPIPEDDVDALMYALQEYCQAEELEIVTDVLEAGVACPEGNRHLKRLLEAAEAVRGAPPTTSRKLAGTSARFAPGGNAVVWGQTGIGPHSRQERHYIPSIEPYMDVLERFARLAVQAGARRK